MASWTDHTHATPYGTVGNAIGRVIEEHYHLTPSGPTSAATSVTYATDGGSTHSHDSAVGPWSAATVAGRDMSNYVFPSGLPGFGLTVRAEPYVDVQVQQSLSGKELRSTYWSAPRYRFEVMLSFLRSADTYREMQSFVDFFVRHSGQLDSFRLLVPEDCEADGQCFGVAAANGTGQTFQLQRRRPGAVYDTTGGPWAATGAPRINRCLQSQAFDVTPWTSISSPTTVLAPDGTVTAQAFALPPTSGWWWAVGLSIESWTGSGTIPAGSVDATPSAMAKTKAALIRCRSR